MKKLFVLLVFLLILVPFVFGEGLKDDLKEQINQKNLNEKISVIILFKEKPNSNDLATIKSDGANVKHQFNLIKAISVEVPVHAAEKIANRPFVELIEPDYVVEAFMDKSIQQINATEVWEMNITGKDIDVAILDTGIHDEHPALTVVNEVDFTGEGTDDLYGHGTHVAGTVASQDLIYKGVSPDANLFNVKVLNQEGSGYSSNIIKGIEWAVDNGAEVISMSLGAQLDKCDGTDALSRAVDKAVEAGVVVVVSAGNSGPDSETISSPGCAKDALTVGAVNDFDSIAYFSSVGPTTDGRIKPDVVAPGVWITSTSMYNTFVSKSGTSMAAPHVSGLVALILEKNPNLKPLEVKEIIKNNSLDLNLDANIQGSGRINVYNTIISLSNPIIEPPINETPIENETIIEDPIQDPTPKPPEENETNDKCAILPYGLAKKAILPKSWQKKCPEAGIKPGSFLYNFERTFENLNLKLTFNEAKKAQKYLQYAEERLAETKELINENNTELVEQLLEDYQKNIEKGNQLFQAAEQNGKDTTEVSELLILSTSLHTEILEEVLKDVPEKVKGTIQKAINSSEKENKKALDFLDNNQPWKATQIHLEIAEKKLNQAQEKVEEGKLEDAEELIQEYNKNVEKIEEVSKNAKEKENKTIEIDEEISKVTKKNLEILEEIQKNISEKVETKIDKNEEKVEIKIEKTEEKVETKIGKVDEKVEKKTTILTQKEIENSLIEELEKTIERTKEKVKVKEEKTEEKINKNEEKVEEKFNKKS